MKPPVYSLIDFKVRSESLGIARKRLREVERQARTKSGVLQYHFLQDLDDPTVFTGYGIFASSRDLETYYDAMKAASASDPMLNEVLDPVRPLTVRTLDRL